ncbi:EF-hand domain-containing protein [Jannaschia pohangensis]|uniref:EF-hand domain pair n=1 Tax=Jannaschia pohangensis TaxID=390807 RepID=A0A1I3I003_9RHOB|nr:EF-hand domain-containing protein [Jannaschia pohangensis]SFI41159.1 EF-hand domain pair [Jannaschia pohangensis]
MTIKLTMPAALFAIALAGPALAVAQWDVDADGTLNPEEFVSGFASMATFSKFDVDSSGTLDATEWDSGLTEIGEYGNMDLNGDGVVDEAEYNALLFNRYDTNGSGTIETEEMAQVEADLAEDGMLSR